MIVCISLQKKHELKFASQEAMAIYMGKWLEEGTIDGIWKKYVLPFTKEVPSLRDAMQGGGDTGLTEMS